MTKEPRKGIRPPGTILIVDPDDSARKTARRLLESLGYRVLDAADAASAEQIARLYVGPIHILLIEATLPVPGGQAPADRLRSLHPESRVLFTSRQPQGELVRRGRMASRPPFIRKPYNGGRLAAKIRSVLGEPS